MTIYHVGNLAADRLKDKELDRTALELWGRAQRRELILLRTRLGSVGDNVFAYSFYSWPRKPNQ